MPLLGRWLTFFANSAEVPGSSLLLNAVQALGLHWATGQSGAEDAQLAALLAWIDRRRAVRRRGRAGGRGPALTPPAGPATDPDFDNHVLAPLIATTESDAGELPEVLRALLLPTWEQMWRALDLLRAAAGRARGSPARWDGDRDAYSAFVQHLAEGGAPQPRRDGAVAAAARLHRLENAATRYAVQRAFDDPLVMAEYRLTGAAFAGDGDPGQGRTGSTTRGKRPVLRPRIMVATTEPVRVEPGAALTSPARPSPEGQGHLGDAAPDDAETEVLLELSGGMGRKLVAEPGSVPEVGERLLLTTLSEAYRPGGAFPDPARPRGPTAARRCRRSSCPSSGLRAPGSAAGRCRRAARGGLDQAGAELLAGHGRRCRAGPLRSGAMPSSMQLRRVLDQAVGVEQQGRAGRDRAPVGARGRRAAAGRAAVPASPTRPRPSPSGQQQQRRRVAGVGEAPGRRRRPSRRSRASTAVAAAGTPQAPCSARSSWVSSGPGSSSRPYASPRTRLRSWPMVAAASMSCPETSPTASITLPSGWANASYQSPPTAAPSCAGQVAGVQLDARDRAAARCSRLCCSTSATCRCWPVEPAVVDREPGPAADVGGGALVGLAERRPLPAR